MRNLALKAYTWAYARKTRDEGQTVVEYAGIVAFVSIVLIAAILVIGDDFVDAAKTAVDGFSTGS